MEVTVAELIEKLKDVDPDLEVYLSDSEYGDGLLTEVRVNGRWLELE
jgi:hypothetical protein